MAAVAVLRGQCAWSSVAERLCSACSVLEAFCIGKPLFCTTGVYRHLTGSFMGAQEVQGAFGGGGEGKWVHSQECLG